MGRLSGGGRRAGELKVARVTAILRENEAGDSLTGAAGLVYELLTAVGLEL